MNQATSPTASKARLGGLAGRLIMDGLITADQAMEAQKEATAARIPFVQHLVEAKGIDSAKIAAAASSEFGVPLMDLRAFDNTQFPEDLVDIKLIQRHHALPLFKRGKRLFIALADPTNLQALDEIKFHTGINTEAIIVDQKALSAAISHATETKDAIEQLGDLESGQFEDLEVEAIDENDRADGDLNMEADDTPIVRFVNKVLLDAIKAGASDIHFEPYEHTYRVRFRADGILKEVVQPPKALAPRLAARLKVMSRMDISERRVPQDGRIQMRLSKTRAIDMRVNTLPTLFGEKIVLRILDPTSATLGIDALGYEPHQKKLFTDALDKPQGMILVTGPTGSGKTVSLYTGLNILNTPERNISTAEDPVEINLDGINQVPVNPKVGLNFADALRSFLRQDPDVIMVGEIRDLETAEISIKAAQTGHLVLSTLHTNSAAETITRLLNMGVPAFNLATAVTLIIAQRLARRLCSKCAEPIDELPEESLLELGFTKEMLKGATIKKAVGCESCNHGYKGRTGIYEVVQITQTIARMILEGKNSMEIADEARKEGFHSLRTSALRKVSQGLISLEEANRVTVD
ncbi:Type IV fimbrial assembly, ATPase PilB [Aequoribacter fuscus]|uniref:Type IV fimbrial assembly, ATPase PilB n=1 Tax=Aequoribacter fuscus TaxID=2518989 RepID=F3L1Q6_9GAMM|nr:type IV-A pilus assembly ATPase PilB [Aequoribacter fuscus]EGG29759.1 Type IV fimbrial assembly, ATPase PilB [Aequoribacter fuscus]